MHSLIYFSFLVLLGVTTVSEINHQMPTSLKFLHGDVYAGFKVVANTAGLALLIGVVWALVRRYIQRPYRIRIKTKPEHAVILGVFLSFAVTGFITEGYRIALDGMNPIEKWSYRGLAHRQGGAEHQPPGRLARGLVDRPRAHVLRLPGHPVDHHAAPHVHRRR